MSQCIVMADGVRVGVVTVKQRRLYPNRQAGESV